jgi:hypothetical protein
VSPAGPDDDSTAGQGPAPVDPASSRALRETLELAAELSDALVGQLQKARRLVADDPSPPETLRIRMRSVEKLAANLRDKTAALGDGLFEEPVEEAAASDAEAGAADEAAAAEQAQSAIDAMRTVILDLKIEGVPREEVERRLMAFGFEDPGPLVEAAFGESDATDLPTDD